MKGGALTGRTELKYLITAPAARIIASRLSTVLPYDAFALQDGSYHVRSLYFDDPKFSSYLDKEAGVRERTKYRIRYYNGDKSFIRLEEKDKIGDLSEKTGVRITAEEAEAFASRAFGEGPFPDPLFEDFSRRIRTGALIPVLFTDYERTAFCYPVGFLRITLDREITASRFAESPWETGTSIPLMTPFQAVLEIKYSGVYPAFITDLLRDIPKTPSAVSKYCTCCEALF